MRKIINGRGWARFGRFLPLWGLLAVPVFAQDPVPAPVRPDISFSAEDRILILAPHPDDEVLACGGVIQKALALHLPLRVVFLTFGDNNEWSFAVYRKHPVVEPSAVRAMGEIRHQEARAAARVLGLDPGQLDFLGYPDFGTFEIWCAHWGDRPPYQGLLTRATAVPYADAFRPGASYKGEEIVRDLSAILREFRPTRVFVSHPADHNPDHRALYLFTRVALWARPGPPPALYPFLVHFKQWPRPRGFQPESPLAPPAFFGEQIHWDSSALGQEEIARKRQALEEHKTQYEYSAPYLLSFVRANELFGDFPTLKLGAARPILESPGPAGEIPSALEDSAELTDAERASFVGVEWRSVRREGDQLVLEIDLSRPLEEAVETSLFAFGYADQVPFERMPKIRVRVSPLGYRVYDQDRLLDGKAVRVTQHPRQITVRIPLDLLGQPRRILTSARTYAGEIPLDWLSWRVVELDPW